MQVEPGMPHKSKKVNTESKRSFGMSMRVDFHNLESQLYDLSISDFHDLAPQLAASVVADPRRGQAHQPR